MRTIEDTDEFVIGKINYYTSILPKKVDALISSCKRIDRDEVIRIQERIKAYKEIATFMITPIKEKIKKDGK